jgi:hypothetical protein
MKNNYNSNQNNFQGMVQSQIGNNNPYGEININNNVMPSQRGSVMMGPGGFGNVPPPPNLSSLLLKNNYNPAPLGPPP